MTWFGSLKKASEDIGRLASRPNLRNFSGKVTEGDTANARPETKGDPFQAERSYFSVRVVEMRLAEAGRYFTEFIPMCSCFLRYTYGRNQRTTPFVLGSETISNGLGQMSDQRAARNIQFNQVYACTNIPVKADNLFLYAALCRFDDSGFARGLLDLFSDAAGSIGGSVAGAAVRSGVDLTKRLADLLGTNGVETRFGVLNGSALDESGYRLFAGTASTDLASADLVMRGGQLVCRNDQEDTTIDDTDYLVIALEYLPTLVDDNFALVSILPFHERFDEARAKLLEGDAIGANGALKRLLIELATSPDVSEADRLALIASYRGAFDQWSAVASGTVRTMSGRKTTAMHARLSEIIDKVRPDVAPLLNCARTGTIESDLRYEAQLTRDSLGDSSAAQHYLALRAAALRAALAAHVGTDATLFRASDTLLSVSMEV